MSYILDALRKSDQQRRRGAVPTLPPLPPTLAPPEQQAWMRYGLFGLIAILAVGMALAWLRPAREVPLPLPAIAAQAATSPAPPVQPRPLAALAPARAVAPAPTFVRPAPVAESSRRPAVGSPVARLPAPAAVRDDPVAMAELAPSIRQDLPPLTVAVHAYTEAPRERLVSIDGRMLREGDLLGADLKLEQITPDGMVFSFRGHRFRRAAQ